MSRGTQVTILNSDSRTHEMDSDPHPEHTDCPELNQIGFLSTGQSRQSGNLNTARKCGMHDHASPDTASLRIGRSVTPFGDRAMHLMVMAAVIVVVVGAAWLLGRKQPAT